MNETDFKNKLKKELETADFFFKKLADRTTRGLPDAFIAKDHKGMFAEFKLIELVNIPTHFSQLSCVSSGKTMLQLTTMVQIDDKFLARYFIGYKTSEGLFIAILKPAKVLFAWQQQEPIELNKFNIFEAKEFISRLTAFLQL